MPTDYSSLNSSSSTDDADSGHVDVGWGVGGLGDTMYLMAVTSIGVTLNALVAASLLTMPAVGHRRSAASFVIHACLLDSVKCAFCVPFAITYLQRVDPSVCDALSRSANLLHTTAVVLN